MGQQKGKYGALSDQERLFLSVADSVNHIFLQIRQTSELATTVPNKKQHQRWGSIYDLSSSSLHLLESYAMTIRLHGGSMHPEIVPVALTALLQETAHVLEPYAKQYGVQVELDLPTKLSPVLSDGAILKSALVSLGQVFVLSQAEREQPQPIRMSAHKGRYGVITGMYAEGADLTSGALRRARMLHGNATQPLSELVGGAAGGILVADTLLQSLSSKLHIARYHKVAGLAATLPACHQLQFV
ncbi:MAG: hypothetical protein WAQ24_00940 [Candidatus Saccharimonadales bacterium]